MNPKDMTDRQLVAALWRAALPPGQQELPVNGMAPDVAAQAQRLAVAPLRPAKPQLPCDVGLFGDTALQADLIDILRSKRT